MTKTYGTGLSHNSFIMLELDGDAIIGKCLLSVTGAKGVEWQWDAV